MTDAGEIAPDPVRGCADRGAAVRDRSGAGRDDPARRRRAARRRDRRRWSRRLPDGRAGAADAGAYRRRAVARRDRPGRDAGAGSRGLARRAAGGGGRRRGDRADGRADAPMADRRAASRRRSTAATRFLMVALDDGIEPDERPPATLAERLAFSRPLLILLATGRGTATTDRRCGEPAPSRLCACAVPAPRTAEDQLVGARSDGGGAGHRARPARRCSRCGRRALRLGWPGATRSPTTDIMLAARLVLAPRATRVPAEAEEAQRRTQPPPPGRRATASRSAATPARSTTSSSPPRSPRCRRTCSPGSPRGAGAASTPAQRRGRAAQVGRARPPAGSARRAAAGRRRLSLIDTLRAAAPWQALRGRGRDACDPPRRPAHPPLRDARARR